MTERTLKNPPLVEAILELRWKLQDRDRTPGLREDPYYSLLIGELYRELKSDYPSHQQLDGAWIPAGMLPVATVQHRFRAQEGGWPLVQLGPGVFTLNDTASYTWNDFRSRAIRGISALFGAYPNTESFEPESLLLRYINGIEFDFDSNDIFAFLESTMHSGISIHPLLGEVAEVDTSPLELDLKMSFGCREPDSVVTLWFSRGKKQGKDALIWQTLVKSGPDQVPELPSGLTDWLEGAHATAEKWFFKLIQGELERRFE